MYRLTLLFVFLLTLQPSLCSETPIRYDYTTDTLTYNQYLRADWKTLKKSVSQANDKGYNFYYLSLRGAFAAFYLKEYHHAVGYFESAKAMATLPNETNYFYFYAAYYAGYYVKASQIRSQLTVEQQKTVPEIDFKYLAQFGAEFGVVSNSNYNYLVGTKIDVTDNIYSEKQVMKNQNYFNIHAMHYLSPRISISQAVSSIGIDKTKVFWTNGATQQKPLTVTQIQYYISPTINFNDKLFFSAGLNYIAFNVQSTNIFYENNAYVAKPFDLLNSSYLASLALRYYNPRFLLSAQTSYFVDDEFTIFQPGFSMLYYFSNNRTTYGKTSLSLLSRKSDLYNDTINIVADFRLGHSFKRAWIEAQFAFGDLQNYNSDNGYILYNTYENIPYLGGLNCGYAISKKLKLGLYYKTTLYNSKSFYYTNFVNTDNYSFQHKNHSLIGGLTWIF